MAGFALKRLMAEYKQLNANPPEGIIAGPSSEDNFFEWNCLISGPPDTCYENGVFPARLSFPEDYPLSPPKMRFTCDLFHPNIYADGKVCISILHTPGDDPTGYESSSERWSPVLSVEKVLISVVSMLAEPNDASPANVDAAKMWRENRAEFERLGRDLAVRTLAHANSIPPKASTSKPRPSGDNSAPKTNPQEVSEATLQPNSNPKPSPDSLKSPSNFVFVLGSLIVVFFGVFLFFKFFKTYKVPAI
ncbi:unnamed protein product [Bursaphelenchus xylophilus]|uniref:Ubiquitin-conjugating enzyme E2 G2 n=1 Tax=Bursaphelenchus xylophilus TaxID=6326 RepID=A0A1I7S7S5_BURXY|nr:unnamed protein product [Bursaphelenchus xylophilus]CAG9086929.1 unnamed protein product [Bursaphelenchus xylophilus]